jgi:hypothetical protein
MWVRSFAKRGQSDLDSTSATTLDPAALLLGQSINLSSGQISVQLTNPGALQPTTGLVLGGAVLTSLQNTAALSLLSYSSLDFYGTGCFPTPGRWPCVRVRFAVSIKAAARSASPHQTSCSTTARMGACPVSWRSQWSVAKSPPTRSPSVRTRSWSASSPRSRSTRARHLDAGQRLFPRRGDLNVVTPFFTASNGATQSLAADGALSLVQVPWDPRLHPPVRSGGAGGV